MTTQETNDNATLDAWTMATSILAGLHKAEVQARTEYRQRVAEVGGRGAGVMTTAHLLEVLMEARRNLEPDLRSIARANGRPMPKLRE